MHESLTPTCTYSTSGLTSMLRSMYSCRDILSRGLGCVEIWFTDLAPHLVFGVVSSFFDVPHLFQLSRLRAALPPQMLQLLAKALCFVCSDGEKGNQTE